MAGIRKFKIQKTFDKWHAGLAVLLFGALGTVLLVLSRAAPNPPTIYLTPESGLRTTNETFVVEVRENSGTTGINAAQANFSYPTNLLDFVSIDTTGSFQFAAESSGGNGQVTIAVGNPTALTGDRLIAKVTFKTKTTGGTASLNFTTGTALVSASSNSNILSGLGATGSASFVIDTTAPTVSLTAPSTGAIIPRVSGTNVTVSATASDNVGVTKVEILVNGAVKTTLSNSPYNYSFSVLDLPLGSSTIQAKAYDQNNNVGTTPSITVNVTDTTAPSISISSPTNGSGQSGTIEVRANASDESGGSGVSKVEFYIDGNLASTDSTSPYTYNWNTTGVSDGQHTISARAYDFASPANTRQSSNVTVNVDNSDKQAPTTPTNLTVKNRTAKSVELGWGASTDNVGVTGYRISRNGSVIATTTSLTYTDNGVSAKTTYSYSVVAVDAKGNVSSNANVSATTLQYGDLNGTGSVDIFDVAILISNYGKTDASGDWNSARIADINGDNKVNIFDVSILLSNYGG